MNSNWIRRVRFTGVTAFVLAAACVSSSRRTSESPHRPTTLSLQYPVTRTVDAGDMVHGQFVRDPYRWLEDANATDVKMWLDSEDALTRGYLEKAPDREALTKRLVELRRLYSADTPRVINGRTFFSDVPEGADKQAVWVTFQDGTALTIFDANSSTEPFVLRKAYPSPDGKRIAVIVSKNNADASEIRVYGVEPSRAVVLEVVPNTFYSNDTNVNWAPDSSGFFFRYAPNRPDVPPPDRPALNEVHFHLIGTSSAKDEVMRGAVGRPNTWEQVHMTPNGRWLVLVRYVGAIHTDILIKDKHAPSPKWVSITEGKDSSFDVQFAGDTLFLRTDDGAANFRIVAVDLRSPAIQNWKEIVPERADEVIDDFAATRSRLLLRTSKDAVHHLESLAHDGSDRRQIPLPTLGTISTPIANPRDDIATYSFESFAYPDQTFVLDAQSNKQTPIERHHAETIDSSKFEVEQVFTKSKDGTRIPIFIVRSRTVKPTGNQPTLLTGYGFGGSGQTPKFIARFFAWVEQGGVFALANIRGGNEYGEEWHRAGMRRKRQNVFDDFLAAASALVERKWTSPSHLAIYGGSAGGLLVAGAETQRPDLFAAVLCEMPLTDMIRYTQFGIGKSWLSSIGDPEDPEDFRALYSYSPYHHVRSGVRYPATLILTPDSDDRLDPMHARKFAAALQAASDGGPVLLRVERAAGHAGSASLHERAEIDADMLSFVRQQMN